MVYETEYLPAIERELKRRKLREEMLNTGIQSTFRKGKN
jgi:hypothetical protein